MQHVDALSRTANTEGSDIEVVGEEVMVVNLSPTDWVVSLQRQDGELQEMIDILSDKSHKQHRQVRKNYELKNGRLYCKTSQGLRFVVPKGVRWYTVKSSHDGLGHLGLERTVQHIQKTYWFPRMRGFVRKYIDNCIKCAYNKRGKDEKNYQLNAFRTEPIPFNVIHIDHLGPYPRSSKGNMYLIGIIDSFTKFVILRAVRGTNTNYVIKVLEELSQFFGNPAKIISDRGTSFTSKAFEQYCRENHIEHGKIAVQTPRANGQIERYFRTISEAIAATTDRSDDRDWDSHLNDIQWGLNSVAHKVTGQSPQKLLLGYEPRKFLHNDLTAILHGELSNEEEEGLLEDLRNNVADRIERQRTKQANRENEKRKSPREYKEGEMVLIKREPTSTGQPRKHLPKYTGPYIIVKVLNSDRYLVADPPGIKISTRPFQSIYAAERIKPWCQVEDLEMSEEGLADGIEEWEQGEQSVEEGVATSTC